MNPDRLVCELADRSLADVLNAERKAGKPGIARDVLLAFMREAAEALDVMHVRHGLQHLDVKPQNLFLVANHVKVGDFGLVQSLSGNGPGDISLGAITPLYVSPEVFQGKISQNSDQYSLAIVYQELLTGTMPFPGKNSRQLLMQHIQAAPDLEAPLDQHDAEPTVTLEAGVGEREVARLEDTKRQPRVGEQHRPEREHRQGPRHRPIMPAPRCRAGQ